VSHEKGSGMQGRLYSHTDTFPVAFEPSLPLALSHWPNDLKWPGCEPISTRSMPNCAMPKSFNSRRASEESGPHSLAGSRHIGTQEGSLAMTDSRIVPCHSFGMVTAPSVPWRI